MLEPEKEVIITGEKQPERKKKASKPRSARKKTTPGKKEKKAEPEEIQIPSEQNLDLKTEYPTTEEDDSSKYTEGEKKGKKGYVDPETETTENQDDNGADYGKEPVPDSTTVVQETVVGDDFVEPKYLGLDPDSPLNRYMNEQYYNDIMATECVCKGKTEDGEHNMEEILCEMIGDNPDGDMMQTLKDLSQAAGNIKKTGNYDLPGEMRETLYELVFDVRNPEVTREVLSALAKKEDKHIHTFLNNVGAQVQEYWNQDFVGLIDAIRDIE
ncbi:MAG: hypothetical protein JW754_02955 [Candidatus Aenigmarchaeota archaeon]|nr:hypothetical protein [Candidatus Aenigmarchaeota archaeon]